MLLARLPSTDALRQQLASLQAEAEKLRAGGYAASADRKRWDIDFTERKLILAEKRDRAAANRPEGCFCLGLGGSGAELRHTPDGREVISFARYCSCGIGQRAAEEHRQRLEASKRRRLKDACDRVWQSAGFPSRFKSFRLDTFPAAEQHMGLITRLRWPALPTSEDAPDSEFDERTARINDWSRSWLLWGQYGRGKTGLAVAYASEWLKDLALESPEYISGRRQLLFISTPDLFSELRDTYRQKDASERDVIAKYAAVPLLILDDLGTEHVKDSGWLEDRLYQIIGKRHGEELTTFFTSNLSLEQLAVKIGERVTWRIVEMCGADHIVHVDGPNLRDR